MKTNHSPETTYTYLHNKNFLIFSALIFLYFSIMATCFPFLPIWLSDVVGINKGDTGLVFSCIALFAIILQPIMGMISDKLGLKKHLLWIIIIPLPFFAPFFLYVFGPLLKFNVILGAIVGGLYIGFVFSAGAGAIEAYVERVSRQSFFEYGKARMFGCIGWGLCAASAGILFNVKPELVFWMGSIAACIIVVLMLMAKPGVNPTAKVIDSLGVNSSQFSLRMVVQLFKLRSFWMFVLYVIGVACIYDVYDQQFANYFKTFFSTPEKGNEVFGFATTAGEAANAIIMFCAPWIINRIGAKKTLLIAGSIMSIRIVGSALASNVYEVVMLKMLHALEVPFLLVGAFKYINVTFDTRLSATIYLIGFQFSKQLGSIFLSTIAGDLYDKIGFEDTYFMLGGIACTVTLISAVTLTGHKKAKLAKNLNLSLNEQKL
ncbi:MFS transporter [Celerinatantimonas sp. YJH-8]|uniref:MFS transporter n=1 Tax=Celerinatantimonas sp. YJH-8 TaxID=3228714 RepID=UPI0038C84270